MFLDYLRRMRQQGGMQQPRPDNMALARMIRTGSPDQRAAALAQLQGATGGGGYGGMGGPNAQGKGSGMRPAPSQQYTQGGMEGIMGLMAQRPPAAGMPANPGSSQMPSSPGYMAPRPTTGMPMTPSAPAPGVSMPMTPTSPGMPAPRPGASIGLPSVYGQRYTR